jgi:glyoxylase-like metal-dependent hydrolase (beta-lactamase superfamily II)
MNRVEITPRLTYWAERHPHWRPNPEWPEAVGCALYRSDEALILVDPLIRDDLDPEAWTWLDREVAASGRPVALLLTAPWHLRSATAVVERYGARVWAAPAGRARAGALPWLGELPSGVETFTPGGHDEGQVAFWLPGERALVVAEFFAGRDGGLVVLTSPAEIDLQLFAESLDALRALPIEHVLVAHGEPVLGGGSASVASALDNFRVGGLA